MNTWHGRMGLATGLLVACARLAGAGVAAEAGVTLQVVEDWKIEVRARLEGGGAGGAAREVSAVLEVPPARVFTVTAEEYWSLPVFNPNAGGWAKGVGLKGVRAQECTTLHLLEPGSLEMRAGPEPTARLFEAGQDYGVDPDWGTFGRLTNGVLTSGQSVFASYRHWALRLDSVVLTREGGLALRPGVPRSAAPAPPELAAGERRLANVWLPGRVDRLSPDHLFPILESAYPEPEPEVPSVAERFLPRTLAKLRGGEPLRILAWGDSVTVGSYLPDPERERWQMQFVTRLRERFPQARIELITEAWGGRSTGSYLAEPPGSEHHYGERVLGVRPDLVVSEFVNDAGLNPEQVEAVYGRLLKDFREIGAEWILLTPHYVRPDWMGLTREREVDDDPRPYVRGLRAFAARHGVALADAARRYGRLWRQGVPYTTLMLNSINHPDARGMRLFADSLMALFPAETPAPPAAWQFDRDGDFEGWTPNADLAEARVERGRLKARGVGPDPILEYQPRLQLGADPWAVVEVRLKADRDGTGELFWSPTTEGRYGGFSQDMALRFPVIGDGTWHGYRLRPFWQAAGQIVRLRLDLYDGAAFELDTIRVETSERPAGVVDPRFDFGAGAAGWSGEDGARVRAVENALEITMVEPRGFAVAPPVGFDAAGRARLNVRMAVDRGRQATLWFAAADRVGLQRASWPVRADGRERTYSVSLQTAPPWRGRIVALALRPSDEAGATARVRWFRVSEAPEGEPELEVRWVGLDEHPARTRTPLTVRAVLENRGGTTVSNAAVELSLPEGLRLAEKAGPRAVAVAPGEAATFTWRVEARRPVLGDLVVSACSATTAPASGRCAVSVTPRLRVKGGGYVPVPKPVRGPYEVGVYYFPGWATASRWQPLRDFPERRPVLGWYREGDPEVADWHIKWAVEHGITFFVYDWYWSRGERQLEHALHDGYLRARYRSYLKYCLLWANHNPPGSSSLEDCRAVTRFWVEHHFRRPEHQQVDGKPLVIVFAPQRLTEDLGPGGVRPALDAMRAECRAAGLAGLYVVGCVGDAAQARQAAGEGYDAVTGYTWPHLGVSAGEWRAPFATVIEGYRRNWEHLIERAGIPLLPPVCGGWDSRPWHGENNYVRFDRTPELFRSHLLDARGLLASGLGTERVRPMLIVEAWNEWGEGAYIEPHQEYGFGYLDALREALTDAAGAHEDVVPADVGRGPYDVPAG